jgi:hypothetical protein
VRPGPRRHGTDVSTTVIKRVDPCSVCASIHKSNSHPPEPGRNCPSSLPACPHPPGAPLGGVRRAGGGMDKSPRPVLAECRRVPPPLPFTACLPALPSVLRWPEPAPRRFAPAHSARGSPLISALPAREPDHSPERRLATFPGESPQAPRWSRVPDLPGATVLRASGPRPSAAPPPRPSPSRFLLRECPAPADRRCESGGAGVLPRPGDAVHLPSGRLEQGCRTGRPGSPRTCAG